MGSKKRKTGKSPATSQAEKVSPSVHPAIRRSTDAKSQPQDHGPLSTPEETLSLLSQLQELRKSSLLTFVTSPDVQIRGDVIEHVYEQLAEMGKSSQIDLFLHSAGGQTEIPWRLITLIRDFCDRFAVLIPSIAHSAATHIAMGANEIVMGPPSELSPVDPARSHPLLPQIKEGEPPVIVSVQDLRHCMEFIKSEVDTKTASPDSLAHVFAALFAKIHPLAVGAIQQSYELSRLISRKALSTHMDPEKEEKEIGKIVKAFSDDFFSHQYRIGRLEAKELGLKVTFAEDDLWTTMWALYESYRGYFSAVRELDAGQIGRPIVWIDSIKGRCILEQVFEKPSGRVGSVQKLEPTQSRWLKTPWAK